MTDRYENIRRALADLDAAAEAHHELAWRDAHVRFVVHANPKTIRELLKERDALEAALEAAQEASPAEDEGRAITAVEVTLFGRACYLPADIAQEVEQACAAHGLAEVNAAMGGHGDGRYPCPRGCDCRGRDCPDCANFTDPHQPEARVGGEVERLRGALKECHSLSVERWRRLLAAEAENERLREELVALKKASQGGGR